jgi:hypothetical protein
MFVFSLIVCITIGCAVPELMENTGFRATNYADASESDPLPGWVLSELKKYPTETFLFEVGKSRGTDKEAFENALAEARNRIATRILRNVQAIVLTNDSVQYDMVREHYSAVLEHYCQEPQRYPALQLGGLSERNLSVNAARTDQYTYALVYIRRDDLKDLYAKQEQRLYQEINRILVRAQNAENALEIKDATKIYLQTYPLYEALKEAEVIQIGAEYETNFSEALTLLEHSSRDTSGGDALMKSHRQVIKRVKELDPKVIANLVDVARTIKSQFEAQQIGILSGKVQLEPLTYRHDGLICQFSRDFSSAIQKQLKWHFVHRMRGFQRKNFNVNMTDQAERYRFSGSCWENGDEITIRETLRDLHTGEFLASSVVSFLNSQLRKPVVCPPPNYKSFGEDKKAFEPRYIVSNSSSKETAMPTPPDHPEPQFSPVGGLEIDIWTDKGRDPVYYTKDETMKVFGRVNQPAYLRLLYILADRKYTLLQDNYHVDPSRINTDVEIGEFVCAPPFGAEILVVAARTEKFPPIQTYEENGYFFLVNQDPASAARTFRGEDEDTRGMKRKDQHNEAQVVVVTMER